MSGRTYSKMPMYVPKTNPGNISIPWELNSCVDLPC